MRSYKILVSLNTFLGPDDLRAVVGDLGCSHQVLRRSFLTYIIQTPRTQNNIMMGSNERIFMLTDNSNEVFRVWKIVAVHNPVKMRVTQAISFKMVICRVAVCSFSESLIIFEVLE